MNDKQREDLDTALAILKPTLIFLPIGLLCYYLFNVDWFLWIWGISQVGWIMTILGGYLHFRNRVK
jgi:hypothetical protein